MNEFREGAERLPKMDLLDKDLRVTFSISREAFDNLPHVSAEDMRTGRERYGVLIGTMERKGARGAHFNIQHAAQHSLDLKREGGTYWEGTDEITVHHANVRDETNRLLREQGSQFKFLGDIHTHPGDGQVAEPSDNDQGLLIELYKTGVVRGDEPFIFGMAVALDETLEMEYNFYRLVRTNSGSGYGFMPLEHSDD